MVVRDRRPSHPSSVVDVRRLDSRSILLLADASALRHVNIDFVELFRRDTIYTLHLHGGEARGGGAQSPAGRGRDPAPKYGLQAYVLHQRRTDLPTNRWPAHGMHHLRNRGHPLHGTDREEGTVHSMLHILAICG